MKILERDIQKTIIDFCGYKKIFCFKINNGGIKKLNGSYIPAQTLGLPDLVIHFDGMAIYLEIKTPTGKLSEHQIAFQEQCEKDKVQYYVIRSLEDLTRILNK